MPPPPLLKKLYYHLCMNAEMREKAQIMKGEENCSRALILSLSLYFSIFVIYINI